MRSWRQYPWLLVLGVTLALGCSSKPADDGTTPENGASGQTGEPGNNPSAPNQHNQGNNNANGGDQGGQGNNRGAAGTKDDGPRDPRSGYRYK